MARRLRSSLTAKAVGLLVLVLVLLSATVGSWVFRQLVTSSQAELDRRGGALLELLERHRDLHLAISMGDRPAAEEILRRALASHDEIAYLAALDPAGRVLAAAARV